MAQLEKHIDGEWWTSRHKIDSFDVMIKMREGHGCKIHIQLPDKITTLRYNFASEEFLLRKATNWLIKNKLLKPASRKQ